MPYTEKQRKLFNAKKKTNPKMAKLAKEANALPAKKAAAKKGKK